MSVDRSSSNMLNLTENANERREHRQEHKNKVAATLINRKAFKGQAKHTALANNSSTGQVMVPVRNLKFN